MILCEEQTSMNSRVLYLVLIKCVLIFYIAFKLSITDHSLSNLSLYFLIPIINLGIIGKSLWVNKIKYFSWLSAIDYLVSEFSKHLELGVYIVLFVKALFENGFDEIKFSVWRSPNDYYIKVVYLDFPLYFSKIKRVVDEIGFFQKSIQSRLGCIGIILRLKSINFLSILVFFAFEMLGFFSLHLWSWLYVIFKWFFNNKIWVVSRFFIETMLGVIIGSTISFEFLIGVIEDILLGGFSFIEFVIALF